MARSENNLNAVLQDTADAIKNKKGTEELICPRDFADEIAGIVPVDGLGEPLDPTLENKLYLYSGGLEFNDYGTPYIYEYNSGYWIADYIFLYQEGQGNFENGIYGCYSGASGTLELFKKELTDGSTYTFAEDEFTPVDLNDGDTYKYEDGEFSY